MTMRVFSGSLATETNTFAPMPTGLESFKDRGYFPAGQHPKELTFFSGPLSGRPLDLQCTVKALKHNLVMTGLAGAPTDMGDSALVEADGMEIVLVSTRNQALGTDVFTQLGCDLAAKRIIVVKSAQHFHASFSKIAAQVIYVGAPGAATPHTATLPYRKIRRPRWPLDDVATPVLLPLAHRPV